MLLLFFLLACAHVPHTTPAQGLAVYDVAVMVGSGHRVVSSVYQLELRQEKANIFSVATLHSEGSWQEGGETVRFDSGVMRPTDPWPFVLQHAISEIPLVLNFKDGAPVKLVDEEGWREAGRTAVEQAIRTHALPEEALSTGIQLLDPVGVLRDLRRNFPGDPPIGSWQRTISVAGVAARLTQHCERTGSRRVRCVGTAQGPAEGAARLHEVEVSTHIHSDRLGLLSLEQSYSGTLVVYDPDEDGVLDRPIAGKRLVQRR